jgi:hypothetical protein
VLRVGSSTTPTSRCHLPPPQWDDGYGRQSYHDDHDGYRHGSDDHWRRADHHEEGKKDDKEHERKYDGGAGKEPFDGQFKHEDEDKHEDDKWKVNETVEEPVLKGKSVGANNYNGGHDGYYSGQVCATRARRGRGGLAALRDLASRWSGSHFAPHPSASAPATPRSTTTSTAISSGATTGGTRRSGTCVTDGRARRGVGAWRRRAL